MRNDHGGGKGSISGKLSTKTNVVSHLLCSQRFGLSLSAGCLTSQQHASVSGERIC